MKKGIAKVKPWYYLFAFFIALPYAAANDGDRIYHWRYLIAYALLILFFIAYVVRYKKESQKLERKVESNRTDKTIDFGKKLVSIILQVVYAWVLCFVLVVALSLIEGDGVRKGTVLPLFYLLLVIGVQRLLVLSTYSRIFNDVRTAVYWVSTTGLLGIASVLLPSSFYGPARFTLKEVLMALSVVVPLQILGHFVMKVRAVDSPATKSK